MFPLIALFVVWLALRGRFGIYAGFATTPSSSSSSPAVGSTVALPNGGSGQVTATAGPVQVINTQPGVSTGQAIINNILGAFGGSGSGVIKN